MTGQQLDRWRWACFALTAAGLAGLYGSVACFSLASFADLHEDLGHGWLVLLVSGCAIWMARARLSAVAAAPDWRGVAALLVCLGLFWFGERGSQIRLSQIGLIGSVIAVPFAFWGAGVARLFLFPGANLLFAVPLGFLDALTVHLRLLSAWLTTGILNGMEITAHRTGTMIDISGRTAFTLGIDEPHLMMRSVFAFAAVAAGYAWLTQKTSLRKVLLFVCAVPLVVLGDFARVCSTVLVSRVMGLDARLFYTAWSGYVVLAAALLALALAGVWIAKVTPGPHPCAASSGERPAAAGPVRGWRGLLTLAPGMLALALTVAFLVNLKLAPRPAPQMDPDNWVAADLPAQVDGCFGWRSWYCQNEACRFTIGEDLLPAAADGSAPACPTCGQPMALRSLNEKIGLPENPRILRRAYTRGDGRTYLVTVVVSRETRISIHRPELCLPLQGSYVQSKEVRTLNLGGGSTVAVAVVKVAHAGEERYMRLVYWFVNARMETPSHWTRILSDMWAEAVYNRLNRWAMVTVFYPWEEDADDAASWRQLGRIVGAWYPPLIGRGGGAEQPKP